MALVHYPTALACDEPFEPLQAHIAAAPPDLAELGAAVARWLRTQALDVGRVARIERLAGGLSHLTYRLRCDHHDLVLRRPLHAQGGLQRLRREFALQAALAPHYPVPEMLHLCDDPHIAGAPFYLMRYVPGIVPQRNAFAHATPTPEDAQRLCANLVDTLIALHRIDPGALGGGDALPADHHPAYLRKRLQHWSGRYHRLKAWTLPDLRWMAQWLIDRVPSHGPVRVLHNDWRLANLVFDAAQPTRIRAVLDWEFAALGDPLMDLGIALSYWVEPGDNALMRRYQWQPSHLPGMFTREQIADRYFAATGRSREHWPFYRVFGLFRYLINLQELHQRHVIEDGEEKAFLTRIWALAHYLNWTCRSLTLGV